MNVFEEKKADIDGFEIPVQCIMQTITHREPMLRAHYHDYVEVLYGIDCKAIIWADGEKHILNSGDMLVINSRGAHNVYSANEKSTYMVIKFLPQILYAAEQSIFEYKYVIPFVANAGQYKSIFTAEELKNSDIPQIMKELMAEWENRTYGFEIALRIYVSRIVLWLIRSWNTANSNKNADMRLIQHAVEYAQNSFTDATAARAADICGLSQSYFSRMFKRIMGKSFTEYVTYIKISEAKRLLASTDKSVTEISLDAGFSTTSYFIDIFKQQVKMTPLQFRKSLK